METTEFRGSPAAAALYTAVRSLPIYDYHCHLSPKAIWEDKTFSDLGSLWLNDHYKWRLMRQMGVDENAITGNESWHEKYLRYADVLWLAAGSPLYAWTRMELNLYFGIDEPLTPQSAERIWKKANETIQRERLSPRKLIERSGVRYIATCDDVADTLEYHEKLAADKTFACRVVPSFRTDAVLMLTRGDYAAYIKRLSAVSGLPISSLDDLKAALKNRLDYFNGRSCLFADVGIPVFPDRIFDSGEADAVFRRALAGNAIAENELSGFIGHMFRFLGAEYRRRGMISQWHLGAFRNANQRLAAEKGPDVGGDCIADAVPGSDLIALLNAIDAEGGLPRTILYSLNPTSHAQFITIAGSFSNVYYGAAWWFCDHRDGILELLRLLAAEGHLCSFPGMLTDSRSFLSYARHDYFRRIVCEMLGGWVESGELTNESAAAVAKALCCGNMQRMVGTEDSK